MAEFEFYWSNPCFFRRQDDIQQVRSITQKGATKMVAGRQPAAQILASVVGDQLPALTRGVKIVA